MATLERLRFDNSYARLHPSLYQVVEPTPLSNPYLVAFNPDAAALVDLDPASRDDPDAPRYLSGSKRLPGAEPIAMLYAGHQFGVWVPQLGDGRAILLGQAVNARGERWDLHLKGAGQTRFSRMGDGRAVLRSTVREYLASEALHALGIPTTRALSIVGSDDPVYRETTETAATLIRMAPSHVRFGSFQVLAARGQRDRIEELADYLIGHHHPDLIGAPDRFRHWFEWVVERTAELVARWTAVGFAHGVLNTDNMSVLGLTLDYGPYGFVEAYDPGFICNHSDDQGRYAFDQQPAIGLWNLARFAEALVPLLSVEEANQALERYPSRFEAAYAELIRAKLGLRVPREEDSPLVGEMLAIMAANHVDFTNWFRSLADLSSDAGTAPPWLRERVHDGDRLDAWVARYGERLRIEARPDQERGEAMRRVNPKYVLRNYLAQQAIERAQAKDYSEVERLWSLFRRPFDDQPEMSRYAEPAPVWARDLQVSCSS
jgi:uncharacterized protein YdiU (UPF0061 family)